MKHLYQIGMFLLAAAFIAGCETTPGTAEERESLREEATAAVNRMTGKDPGLRNLLDSSYGYVIFPSVGKGGLVVGGAYGRGVVYEQGKAVGYADLSQASVGLQAGGQEYQELILFENEFALRRFQAGNYTFGGGVSAVALKAGAAASANFTNGVAVFTDPKGGLMFTANIEGQKFNYEPFAKTSKEKSTHQKTE